MMRALGLAAILAGTVSAASQTPISGGLFQELHWRQLGPFRGGWATVVDGVPAKPNTFYFGAAGGGVWKTDDAGGTWAPFFQSGPAASIGALTVAPSNPNVVYIGTGQPEPRYDVAAGLGIFKSIDGGAHWSSLGLANTRYIGRIWVDPKNPDAVIVGAQGHFFGPSSDRGVYRSVDGGKSWSHVLKIDNWTGVCDVASDPRNPRLIFAAAWEAHQYPWLSYFNPPIGPGSAIYKSADEGKTWQRLSGGGWPKIPIGRIGLAVTHLAKGTRIYASVDSKTAGGLYRSDDGGAHWTLVNSSKAVASMYFSRLTVAPNNPDIVYEVGQSIRRCVRGGTECEIFKGAPGGDDYHHIWINPQQPDHLITGSDQGAVVSVNAGATWSSWYNQPTGQFYHLETDNRFPYWIYSGQQDSGTVAIASRSDYGQLTFRDWHPVGGEERDYDVPDPADPDIVYASGLGGRVTKWDGRTGQVSDVTPWPESNYGKRPTLTKYHYMWVTPLVPSRIGTPAIYLGGQVVFRSPDQGESWKVISGDLTGKRADAKNCEGDVLLADAKTCGYGSISSIAPSPRDAQEIWVGTDSGLIQLTRDGGSHWTSITPPAVAAWAKVSTLDVSVSQAGVAYAAIDGHRIDDFQPHVLVTHDYGRTWREIDAGLPRDHFVSVVRSDPKTAGLLYAGTDNGVFVSFDDGGRWQPIQFNLPNAWVMDLAIHGDDLIAATQGRSIWVLDDVAPLREISSTNFEAAHLFTPAQAWRVHPNNNQDTPLPPETPVGENPPRGAMIDYWLNANTHGAAMLEIFDATGQLVRRFSSADVATSPPAERYFAKAWTKPPETLAATPGLHRFVWNLRYERPDAAELSYSIAAVWGRSTPIEPQGAWVLPGTYTVALTANGKRYTAPLTVTEDPRLIVSFEDLRASLALSQRIGPALADAALGYREQRALNEVLDKRFPESAKLHETIRKLLESLRARTADGLPSFESVSEALAGVERALEAADVAPTAAQQQFVTDTLAKLALVQREWDRRKTGSLADLNAELARTSEQPVVIPVRDKLSAEQPEEGEDLP
jgi:photosystem II stability/assembly factor-like uncharacterized protein